MFILSTLQVLMPSNSSVLNHCFHLLNYLIITVSRVTVASLFINYVITRLWLASGASCLKLQMVMLFRPYFKIRADFAGQLENSFLFSGDLHLYWAETMTNNVVMLQFGTHVQMFRPHGRPQFQLHRSKSQFCIQSEWGRQDIQDQEWEICSLSTELTGSFWS